MHWRKKGGDQPSKSEKKPQSPQVRPSSHGSQITSLSLPLFVSHPVPGPTRRTPLRHFPKNLASEAPVRTWLSPQQAEECPF